MLTSDMASEDDMTYKAVRLGLGIALVLHGLGNAVLPLRGIDATAPGHWSLAVVMAYTLAIVGFVAAGLAVLGVRPLSGRAFPVAAVAGVAALAAQLHAAAPDLWVGVALSLLLPVVTGLWAAFTPPPGAPTRRRLWRTTGDAVGLAFLVWVAASATLWSWHRTWGARTDEWSMALPGDRTTRAPALELLHGVTIDAPAPAVWAWLVQLGQDRAGFYSYERLERLFGADVHHVRDLRPEWQARRPGDRVPATQANYLGGVFGDRPGWTVDLAELDRALVLRNWGAFVLLPQPDGRTRFLIRSTVSHERIPAWAAAINLSAFELPHFIMQRRMMLNIKALAEQSAAHVKVRS